MAPDVLILDERFNGPPGSGNGGYSAGRLAAFVDGPAEVTLRLPPPLGRELQVVRDGDEVRLVDDDALVAVALPAIVDVEVPAAVSLEQARAAAERFPWYEGHPYPTCFVCGPARPPGDGLHIYAGPVEGTEVGGAPLHAAPWTPSADLAGEDGVVDDVFVWCALDCPGSTPVFALPGVGSELVLGRLAVDVRAPVRAGEPHVVQGWAIGRDGRKLYAGSALFTADGEPLAVAASTWIVLRRPVGG